MWVGHVARMEAVRNVSNILVGNMKRRDRSEHHGVGGKMLLEWILGVGVRKCELDACDSG